VCNHSIFEEHFEIIILRSKASTKIFAFIRNVRLRVELSLFFMLSSKQDTRHREMVAANETGTDSSKQDTRHREMVAANETGTDMCHVAVET
jgi:hypothetical protein